MTPPPVPISQVHFEGAFETGRQRGAGKLTLEGGGTLEGDGFLDCLLRGKGVRRWAGGEQYEGLLDEAARRHARTGLLAAPQLTALASWGGFLAELRARDEALSRARPTLEVAVRW